MFSPAAQVQPFNHLRLVGCLLDNNQRSTCDRFSSSLLSSPLFSPHAVVHRSESKLIALKERLSSEYDTAASTLPIIVADSFDDEAIAEMVSQAKVTTRHPRHSCVPQNLLRMNSSQEMISTGYSSSPSLENGILRAPREFVQGTHRE